ncbi:MAG: hypothetical protein FJY75_12260 [Candidatus Eisenbacteria bacterium]|uniref:Uncharacterized protein n=1 Tax=Eiseniibacteriota bacterium TaxID=2212470 RepID=A0A938BRS1_UNCEI|nr:hypothetical protein [Candidatus Eisenbacteria bacterium]
MPTTGAKFQEAEATLPADLRDIYRRLVQDYEDLTTLHFGRGYVAYKVLADLVLAGWRPAAEPREGAVE